MKKNNKLFKEKIWPKKGNRGKFSEFDKKCVGDFSILTKQNKNRTYNAKQKRRTTLNTPWTFCIPAF